MIQHKWLELDRLKIYFYSTDRYNYGQNAKLAFKRSQSQLGMCSFQIETCIMILASDELLLSLSLPREMNYNNKTED